MPGWGWAVVGIGAVAVVVLAYLAAQRTRSRRLQQTFGPEYGRAVAEHGDRRTAESDLRDRQQERERLEIAPLPARLRERYGREWERVQASFVDDPAGAVADADRLVAEVMRERGYPVDDFEQQAALVSVDHPAVVENYREGHAIYLGYDRGDAGTEDLRQAMHHYRALFDELLAADGEPDRVREPVADGAPNRRRA